jgi:hypothetical protein
MVLAALGTVVYDDYPSLKYRQHGGNAIGAATSIYRDYARRLGRFFSNDQGGVFGVAAQAEEFRRCLGPRLPARQASLVDRLVTGKKSLAGRVGLALSSDFVRQRLVDTVILRILFLLARF